MADNFLCVTHAQMNEYIEQNKVHYSSHPKQCAQAKLRNFGSMRYYHAFQAVKHTFRDVQV